MQGYSPVLDPYLRWEQEELAWIDPATGQPIATVEDERSRAAREREARIEQLEAHIEEREARAAAERRQLTGDIRHTPGLRLRERRRPMGGRCRRAEHQPVLPGGAKRHPKRHRDPRTGTQRPPYLQHQGEPRTGEPPGHQRLLQHRHLQHPHRVYKGIPGILEHWRRPKRPQRGSPKLKSRWNLHFGGTEEWDIGIQVVFMSCYCGKVLPSR